MGLPRGSGLAIRSGTSETTCEEPTMALIKCKSCGKQIASDARTCPHCGKTYTSAGGILVAVILGLIIGGWLFFRQ
jgi:ribosomal protein L32